MLPPELVHNVLESAPEAVVVSDASGSIVFVNLQVTTMFGYRSDEMLGQRLEQLLPERSRARHAGHRERFALDPRVRRLGAGLNLLGRRKDGSEFPVEISLSPVLDGKHGLIVAVLRDVTDRRHIEAELIAARQEADRANLAKGRFLAMASHDLRQPVQALSLLNGTLRRIAGDESIVAALAQQERAVSAMSQLLNALLDISKLESGTIKPEVSDFLVAPMFESLHGEFASLADSKGLQLRIEPCQGSARSDPALVAQILRNLLSNAIKYTLTGRVSLRCQRERGVVRLEVLDTGIGIPASQIPYIHDEFFQVGVASNATRNGYGLGLSIVSRLVKLLNLRLGIRSEVDIGTLFSLELPASTSSAQTGARTTAPTPSAKQSNDSRRVLLVEDDAGVREATRLLLKAAGYDVVTAVSPAEARQKMDDGLPLDLVISDYHLGVAETGDQVIAALRSRRGSALKAILVTGDTSPALKSLGADQSLRVASKPVHPEQLLALLFELLAGER